MLLASRWITCMDQQFTVNEKLFLKNNVTDSGKYWGHTCVKLQCITLSNLIENTKYLFFQGPFFLLQLSKSTDQIFVFFLKNSRRGDLWIGTQTGGVATVYTRSSTETTPRRNRAESTSCLLLAFSTFRNPIFVWNIFVDFVTFNKI